MRFKINITSIIFFITFPTHAALQSLRTHSRTSLLLKRMVSALSKNASPITQRVPETIDFNVNGVCNLDCKFCWGPVHNAKEDITLGQWKNLAQTLRKLGMRNVVFTGGETLLKKDLPELLRYVKVDLGLRTTLSTNGLLLKKRGSSMLPYVDDLGLPLDGHNLETNALMRKGTLLHFSKVLEAIKFVQDHFPRVQLTVRTVAAAQNIHSVPFIGKTMLDAGINPATMRWKIYQVSPIGPRKAQILNHDWLITKQQFEETVRAAKVLNTSFVIEAQPYVKSFGRYYHIFPDGKSHIVVEGAEGLPEELPTGNIVKDFDKTIENLNKAFNFNESNRHGKD